LAWLPGIARSCRTAQPCLVRVDWLAARPLEQAVWEPGLFANQMTVCKLRDQTTIDFVLELLGLVPEEPAVGV
jgi:hypothetical protein